jgi:hypothetical protein
LLIEKSILEQQEVELLAHANAHAKAVSKRIQLNQQGMSAFCLPGKPPRNKLNITFSVVTYCASPASSRMRKSTVFKLNRNRFESIPGAASCGFGGSYRSQFRGERYLYRTAKMAGRIW